MKLNVFFCFPLFFGPLRGVNFPPPKAPLPPCSLPVTMPRAKHLVLCEIIHKIKSGKKIAEEIEPEIPSPKVMYLMILPLAEKYQKVRRKDERDEQVGHQEEEEED